MKSILFITVLIFGLTTQAQQLNLNISVFENGYALENAKVEVSQYGQVLVNESTTNSGQVALVLPLNYDYQVKVYKEGYVSKIAHVSARTKNTEDLPKFLSFPMEIDLFKDCDAVDYSFMDTIPMVAFQLDENGQMKIDLKRSKEAKNRLSKAKVKGLTEEEKQKYQTHFHKGQELMELNQFETAEKELEKAKYIRSCGDIEAYISRCKRMAKTHAKYESYIQKGESFLAENNYTSAKEAFEYAKKLRPDLLYADEKLIEIEKKLKTKE